MSGTTPPPSTTRPLTPGVCTSTAPSTGRSPWAANFTPESTSVQHAAIGSALTSNGTAAGFFQGAVDEVRIWNVARTQARDPGARRTRQLTSGTGLIARYGLNEGPGATAASSVGRRPVGQPRRRPDLDAGRPAGRRRQRTRRPPSSLSAPADAGRAGTSVTLSATADRLGHARADRHASSVASARAGSSRRSPPIPARRAPAQPGRALVRRSRPGSATSGTSRSTTAPRRPRASTRTFNTAPGADPVFVGVGDIADCTSSGDEATGALVAGIAGSGLTPGDNVYRTARPPSSRTATTRRWGGATKARTRPVPGNHDWNSGNLNGYFGYFGALAAGTGDVAVLQLRRRPVLARRRARQ